MRQAKASQGCTWCLYDEHVSRSARSLADQEGELRRALRRGELELHYQPRLCLDTGRVVGIEALVRWLHPERGLLGPDAFIPMAEESGLIVPLGYWSSPAPCATCRACTSRVRTRCTWRSTCRSVSSRTASCCRH